MNAMEDKVIQYDAFISYRHLHPDMDVAMKLQKLLENYKPPKNSKAAVKRRLRIFTDKTELPLSSNLGDGIHIALQRSNFLIVVCSPETKNSKWCLEEVRYFKELHKGCTDRILVVVVDGPLEDTLFHEIMHSRVMIPDHPDSIMEDREIEPLCANVISTNKFGSLRLLKKEFLRIAAPILGCDYDELFQRNKKRRQKIMAAAAGITAILIMVGVIMSQQIVMTIQDKNVQVEEQKAVIAKQSNQSMIDEINIKASDILEEVNNGNKVSALQKMGMLWSEHKEDEYAQQVQEVLRLPAIRGNYAEQFSTWARASISGGLVSVAADGEMVAVLEYPENGKATIHLYDKLLTEDRTITVDYDDSIGFPVKFIYNEDGFEIHTMEGNRQQYDPSGNIGSSERMDSALDGELYTKVINRFAEEGTFDTYPNAWMYSIDEDRIAVLFSDSSSPEYDPYAPGGFVIYDQLTDTGSVFSIPAPSEITGDDMFNYDSIVLVPEKNAVLISLVRGVYETYLTAYSTITGENLCTIDINAPVNLQTDCIFSAIEIGWVLVKGSTPGDSVPFVSYFSLPAELGDEWTYGKRLFQTNNNSLINDLSSFEGTLYVLTDNDLQAVAMRDISLTDQLTGAEMRKDFDDRYENNPLITSNEYGLSVPDQTLELEHNLKLYSTGIPWYYDDEFYTGMQMQLNVKDEEDNTLFSIHQLDMDTYPYYSETDGVIGFIAYEGMAESTLLPLKSELEILNSVSDIFTN